MENQSPPERRPLRQERPVDPLFGNRRIGLAIMEVQVLHYGHIGLLTWMRATCGKCVVGLGSSQLGRQPGHPFTFEQRKAMIEAVFGVGAFSFVSLNDIESAVPEDWMEYVGARLSAIGVQPPTDYFCGSRHDSSWYQDAFARIDGEGTREGPGVFWEHRGTGRRLHILEREQGDLPSARQIRDLVELRDPEWRRFVPPVLWRYVDWHYPPEHRVALRGDELPEAGLFPVETRFKGNGPGAEVVILRDDGKWRAARARPDEKGEYARARAAARDER